MIGFYGQFVLTFADAFKRTDKGNQEGLTKDCELGYQDGGCMCVFEKLLVIIITCIYTCMYDHFSVITDASSCGIRGVLCVTCDDLQCPVFFLSRQQQEREMLYTVPEL